MNNSKKVPQTNYTIEISGSQNISWLEYLEALVRKEHNLGGPSGEDSTKKANNRTGWQEMP